MYQKQSPDQAGLDVSDIALVIHPILLTLSGSRITDDLMLEVIHQAI